jgi:hypothetical protein
VATGLDPTSRYQLVGWARCSELDAALHFTMIGYDVTAQTGHGASSSIEYDFMAPLPNTWRRYVSGTFSPEGTTATLWLRASVQRSLGRTVRADFDDVHLIEIPSLKVSSWQVY